MTGLAWGSAAGPPKLFHLLYHNITHGTPLKVSFCILQSP